MRGYSPNAHRFARTSSRRLLQMASFDFGALEEALVKKRCRERDDRHSDERGDPVNVFQGREVVEEDLQQRHGQCRALHNNRVLPFQFLQPVKYQQSL